MDVAMASTELEWTELPSVDQGKERTPGRGLWARVTRWRNPKLRALDEALENYDSHLRETIGAREAIKKSEKKSAEFQFLRIATGGRNEESYGKDTAGRLESAEARARTAYVTAFDATDASLENVTKALAAYRATRYFKITEIFNKKSNKSMRNLAEALEPARQKLNAAREAVNSYRPRLPSPSLRASEEDMRSAASSPALSEHLSRIGGESPLSFAPPEERSPPPSPRPESPPPHPLGSWKPSPRSLTPILEEPEHPQTRPGRTREPRVGRVSGHVPHIGHKR
jgi:hypothetical protein